MGPVVSAAFRGTALEQLRQDLSWDEDVVLPRAGHYHGTADQHSR